MKLCSQNFRRVYCTPHLLSSSRIDLQFLLPKMIWLPQKKCYRRGQHDTDKHTRIYSGSAIVVPSDRVFLHQFSHTNDYKDKLKIYFCQYLLGQFLTNPPKNCLPLLLKCPPSLILRSGLRGLRILRSHFFINTLSEVLMKSAILY